MNNLIVHTVDNFASAFKLGFNWDDAIEVLIIAAILITIYKNLIKNTQSEKLVKGVIFLFFAWILSGFLIIAKLQIIGMFIRTCTWLVAWSLIVVFQPELRRFLGYLGQPGFINIAFWKHNNTSSAIKTKNVIKEVIEAVKYLSKTRTGALIVFQKDMTSGMYNDVGTELNADISTELILTIFHINTPLHDGAMIVKDAKILSAGVLLPLTEDPKLSWKYGTRHRAAIGMSEVSDAACLVVSEETGDVSISVGGILKKYEDLATLKKDLMNILGLDNENSENVKKSVLKKIANNKNASDSLDDCEKKN